MKTITFDEKEINVIRSDVQNSLDYFDDSLRFGCEGLFEMTSEQKEERIAYIRMLEEILKKLS